MALSPSWRLDRWGVFLLLVVAILMSGCGGGGRATVSGTVSYKGNLLKGGHMAFVGAAGKTSVADIGKDGKYTALAVPTGKVTITIETESLNPARYMGKSYSAPPGVETKGATFGGMSIEERKERYVQIPANYAGADTSDLTLEVKGSMTHNIDLK
jgi:hypothetical protein